MSINQSQNAGVTRIYRFFALGACCYALAACAPWPLPPIDSATQGQTKRLVIQSSGSDPLSALFNDPAFIAQLLPAQEYGRVKVVSVPPGTGASNEGSIVVVKRKITRRVQDPDKPVTSAEPPKPTTPPGITTSPVLIVAEPSEERATAPAPQRGEILSKQVNTQAAPVQPPAARGPVAISTPVASTPKRAEPPDSIADQPKSDKKPVLIASDKPAAEPKLVAKAAPTTKIPVSLDGLKQQSAKWPLSVRPTNVFGAKSPEGSAWKGLVFKSKSGTNVKAVAPGRVVFAQSMRGYGNLIIVDHGRQYISIYGYNSVLTKQVGDIVNVGETIATTGNTGPIVDDGLYFEIRKDGMPINPMLYLASSP